MRWSAVGTDDDNAQEKQVLKLVKVSEQFHKYAKGLGYRGLFLSQEKMYDKLEQREFAVVRPRGSRQVTVYLRAEPETETGTVGVDWETLKRKLAKNSGIKLTETD
jgi:hypothetical protein